MAYILYALFTFLTSHLATADLNSPLVAKKEKKLWVGIMFLTA